MNDENLSEGEKKHTERALHDQSHGNAYVIYYNALQGAV